MQNNVEKEYSQALFTLACEENSAEKYYEELPEEYFRGIKKVTTF